ncbi:RebB family R body protein [Rhodocista pekingensis]|uniref:RebB family R body protein n=1 Tax=Rhodocista pekingensis TaxID=201185 RepID=A0ABW2KVW4_9PROT
MDNSGPFDTSPIYISNSTFPSASFGMADTQAYALGTLMLTNSMGLSQALLNSVNQQQQSWTAQSAVTARAIDHIMGSPTVDRAVTMIMDGKPGQQRGGGSGPSAGEMLNAFLARFSRPINGKVEFDFDLQG